MAASALRTARHHAVTVGRAKEDGENIDGSVLYGIGGRRARAALAGKQTDARSAPYLHIPYAKIRSARTVRQRNAVDIDATRRAAIALIERRMHLARVPAQARALRASIDRVRNADEPIGGALLHVGARQTRAGRISVRRAVPVRARWIGDGKRRIGATEAKQTHRKHATYVHAWEHAHTGAFIQGCAGVQVDAGVR